MKYVLALAVVFKRIEARDIERHEGLVESLSASEEGAEGDLDALWKAADPDGLSHRLALLYAKRCAAK